MGTYDLPRKTPLNQNFRTSTSLAIRYTMITIIISLYRLACFMSTMLNRSRRRTSLRRTLPTGQIQTNLTGIYFLVRMGIFCDAYYFYLPSILFHLSKHLARRLLLDGSDERSVLDSRTDAINGCSSISGTSPTPHMDDHECIGSSEAESSRMKSPIASEDERGLRCTTDRKETGSRDHDRPRNSSEVSRSPRLVLRWFHLVQTKMSIAHNAIENQKIFVFDCDKNEIEMQSAVLTSSMVVAVGPLASMVSNTRDVCAVLLLTFVLIAGSFGQSELFSWHCFCLGEPDPEKSSDEGTGVTSDYHCTCCHFWVFIDLLATFAISLTARKIPESAILKTSLDFDRVQNRQWVYRAIDEVKDQPAVKVAIGNGIINLVNLYLLVEAIDAPDLELHVRKSYNQGRFPLMCSRQVRSC